MRRYPGIPGVRSTIGTIKLQDDARLTILIQLPGGPGARTIEMRKDIPREIYERSLGALPRDREIDPLSRREALLQEKRRDDLAKILAMEISAAILELCAKDDPVNGYTRDEL